MTDYILLMHNDADNDAIRDWGEWLAMLRSEGAFQGGSAIGSGVCMRHDGREPATSDQIVGYIRLQATNLAHVRQLLAGNPVFEGGGTIEVRELPRTD